MDYDYVFQFPYWDFYLCNEVNLLSKEEVEKMDFQFPYWDFYLCNVTAAELVEPETAKTFNSLTGISIFATEERLTRLEEKIETFNSLTGISIFATSGVREALAKLHLRLSIPLLGFLSLQPQFYEIPYKVNGETAFNSLTGISIFATKTRSHP